MGTLVCGVVFVYAMILLCWVIDPRDNHRVRMQYLKTGLKTYPHTLLSGRVVWYLTADDTASS